MSYLWSIPVQITIPALALSVKEIVGIAFLFLIVSFAIVALYRLWRQLNKATEHGKQEISALTRDATDDQATLVLLRSYHEQSLAQSQVTLWFSLIAASIGFFVVICGAFFLDGLANRLVALGSGTIVDAVSALFFVQSTRASQVMTAFFDKLRDDRKLRTCLDVSKNIEDSFLRSRVQATLALEFSGTNIQEPSLMSIINAQNHG